MYDTPAARDGRRQTHKQIVDAAMAMIEEGRGLADLGLGPTEVAERAKIPRRTYADHFGSKGKQRLQEALAARFHEWAVKTAQQNQEHYQQAFTAWEYGTHTRGTLKAAIKHDLTDWQGPDFARRFFVMLALADLDSEIAGTNYKHWLARAHRESQREYEHLYEALCEMTGREFAVDRGVTQRSMNAYLEGVNLHSRYGEQPSEDEVADTLLAIFHATTKPKGGEAVDVWAQLFGEPDPDRP